jgi:hypothetical protein
MKIVIISRDPEIVRKVEAELTLRLQKFGQPSFEVLDQAEDTTVADGVVIHPDFGQSCKIQRLVRKKKFSLPISIAIVPMHCRKRPQ